MFSSRIVRQGHKRSDGFLCFRDPRRGSIVFGIITVIQSIIWTGFASYELSKMGDMIAKYDTAAKRRLVSSFEDKDGYNIDSGDVDKMLVQSRVEQTICIIFMLLMVSLAFSAGGVLIGGEDRQMKMRLRLWLVLMLIATAFGSVANILDCLAYGFHMENNIQIITWITYILLTLNGFKCVYEYYKSIGRPEESGTDMNGNHVFSISEQIEMELALAPPSYQEVMANDLVDPPDYDTYMRQMEEQRHQQPLHVPDFTTQQIHYDRGTI